MKQDACPNQAVDNELKKVALTVRQNKCPLIEGDIFVGCKVQRYLRKTTFFQNKNKYKMK